MKSIPKHAKLTVSKRPTKYLVQLPLGKKSQSENMISNYSETRLAEHLKRVLVGKPMKMNVTTVHCEVKFEIGN